VIPLGSLLRASHPEPTVAVTALATALALSAGLGASSLLVTAAFLTGQLSVGWSNDWVDAARDVRTGRSDKPVARGDLPVGAVRAAALTAAALCVPASLALGLVPGLLHLTAVAAAWSYNVRLKSTLASWVPYAFAFGAVPSIVTLTLPGGPPAPAWATLAGALLGVGAHLCNVLPDLDEDLATGVRGLPHALGARRSGAVAAVLLLAAALLLAIGPGDLDRCRWWRSQPPPSSPPGALPGRGGRDHATPSGRRWSCQRSAWGCCSPAVPHSCRAERLVTMPVVHRPVLAAATLAAALLTGCASGTSSAAGTGAVVTAQPAPAPSAAFHGEEPVPVRSRPSFTLRTTDGQSYDFAERTRKEE
jgi:4-hydroxybenzoate polyprenyltransferase